MAIFLGVSFYGLDFGIHWDEVAAKLHSVRDTVKTGLFIQGSGGDADGDNYNYGGVNYLLTWTGFAPEVYHFLKHRPLSRQSLEHYVAPVIYEMSTRLRVRAIYLVLCSLSILWLFLLVIELGRSRIEAFLAAGILSASWEVEYHSRWMAPDELMMQFVLLSFLCLAFGSALKKSYWLYFSAISAGLAIGTKYPAALVLPFLLVGIGCLEWEWSRSAMRLVKRVVGTGSTAVLTFVLTSPGIAIDPFRFFYQINFQRTVYGSGFYGYTVKPGLPHFLAILEYFGLQVFSHYWPVSLILAAFCLVGFASIVRGPSILMKLLFAGFALAYVAYFSQQAAMIVRNLLVVAPFFCMAVARGVVFAADRLNLKPRAGLYVGIGILLAINVGWEVYAADQIRKRVHTDYFLTKFEKYARNSPKETYLVSMKLSAALRSLPNTPVPANIVTDPGTAYTKVALLQSEGPDIEKFARTWPSNRWGLYETTFGALEVNLDAYPTFVGNQRILLLTAGNFPKIPFKMQDLMTP